MSAKIELHVGEHVTEIGMIGPGAVDMLKDPQARELVARMVIEEMAEFGDLEVTVR